MSYNGTKLGYGKISRVTGTKHTHKNNFGIKIKMKIKTFYKQCINEDKLAV
jgi:hypothetical protein